jgi:antitoxin component YwqK of YwqJK toxin-antitoxin module
MYGRIYTTATSAFYYKKTIIYNTGETIISKDYDMDLEKVDTEGIHFFLTRKMAEEYDVYHIENGIRIMYHVNGMKQSEAIFNNGTVNGLYKSWYPSGKKHVECMCVNGNNHGLYTRWYESGQKEYEGMFIHGKKEGIHEEWYESGKSKIIA